MAEVPVDIKLTGCSVSLDKLCVKKTLELRENRLKIDVQQIKGDIDTLGKIAEENNQQHEQLQKALAKIDSKIHRTQGFLETLNGERSSLIAQMDEKKEDYANLFGNIVRYNLENVVSVTDLVNLNLKMGDKFLSYGNAKAKCMLDINENEKQIEKMQNALVNSSAENLCLYAKIKNVARAKELMGLVSAEFQARLCNKQRQLMQVEAVLSDIRVSSQNKNNDDTSIVSDTITYKCDFEGCGKSYTKKKSRDSHYKRHYNVFKCDVCGISFNQKDSLVKHMRCHSGDKPYQCPKCDKRFTQKYNMELHCKKIHNGKSNTG